MHKKINIFWFRRDLRLNDNHGLFQALKDQNDLLPIFIFDISILSALGFSYDRRVHYIHYHVAKIKTELAGLQSDLRVFHGRPVEILGALFEEYSVGKVFCNHDYEPGARERDAQIAALCAKKQIEFCTFKDQVIFEKSEVSKPDGLPYHVFTPYAKRWLSRLEDMRVPHFETEPLFSKFLRIEQVTMMPKLDTLGFQETNVNVVAAYPSSERLLEYEKQRDFPAVAGTSRISMALRFGTISIRSLVHLARSTSEKYLLELIWREFYMMVLWHYPETVNQPFQKKYSMIGYRNAPQDFEKWSLGQTGFALVDAGMRELNSTGFMHNRVRMVTASFLCKQLLCDWRLGERYFAAKLNDFELSSNVGGWQWCAGVGADAAPYFRIFNPDTQLKKFDPELRYVHQFIPEYGHLGKYPEKMVDLKMARERCLTAFGQVLS